MIRSSQYRPHLGVRGAIIMAAEAHRLAR